MSCLSFIVPYEPVPWQRTGGRAHRYDTERNRVTKNIVRVLARMAMREAGLELFDGPLAMYVRFYVSKPDSKIRKEQGRMSDEKWLWTLYPCGRNDGDVDNFVKLAKDAMEKVVYTNDARIVTELNHHRYVREGEEPCTVVSIWPLTEEDLEPIAAMRRAIKGESHVEQS